MYLTKLLGAFTGYSAIDLQGLTKGTPFHRQPHQEIYLFFVDLVTNGIVYSRKGGLTMNWESPLNRPLTCPKDGVHFK
jgi:hypothetical protein